LVKANGIDVADDAWREVFLKHGPPELHENYSEFKDAPSPVDLDMPDWSGADWSNERVSPEAAYRFCEQYAREMPELVKRLRAQRRTPCPVEFAF
jgi:hypothetical protein